MKLEKAKLISTKPISIFIEKTSQNLPINQTSIGIIPESRRENVSWKGFYYTIQPNEVFYFDRTNDWDRSFFKLENGVEFKIWCGDPMVWIKNHSVTVEFELPFEN